MRKGSVKILESQIRQFRYSNPKDIRNLLKLSDEGSFKSTFRRTLTIRRLTMVDDDDNEALLQIPSDEVQRMT